MELEENEKKRLIDFFEVHLQEFFYIKYGEEFDVVTSRTFREYFFLFELEGEDLTNKTILDIGCGGSNFVDYCNHNIKGCRAFSIDLSSTEHIKKKFKKEMGHVFTPDKYEKLPHIKEGGTSDYKGYLFRHHNPLKSKFEKHVATAWQVLPFKPDTFDEIFSLFSAIHYVCPSVNRHEHGLFEKIYTLYKMISITKRGGNIRIIFLSSPEDADVISFLKRCNLKVGLCNLKEVLEGAKERTNELEYRLLLRNWGRPDVKRMVIKKTDNYNPEVIENFIASHIKNAIIPYFKEEYSELIRLRKKHGPGYLLITDEKIARLGKDIYELDKEERAGGEEVAEEIGKELDEMEKEEEVESKELTEEIGEELEELDKEEKEKQKKRAKKIGEELDDLE